MPETQDLNSISIIFKLFLTTDAVHHYHFAQHGWLTSPAFLQLSVIPMDLSRWSSETPHKKAYFKLKEYISSSIAQH